MNPLTNVKNINKINEIELASGTVNKKSWHDIYKDSAWVFIGGLAYGLTEGDVLSVFSQYGEIVNLNLIRDKKTGKIKGYCFLCYANQKSTVLAVDNLNGIKLCNRTIRVDHMLNYKPPKENEQDDELTKQLKSEGCAPKPIKSETVLDDYEETTEKKKSKKNKKEKKKHKKKRKHENEEEHQSHKKIKVKKEKHDPGYDKYELPETTKNKDINHNKGHASERDSSSSESSSSHRVSRKQVKAHKSRTKETQSSSKSKSNKHSHEKQDIDLQAKYSKESDTTESSSEMSDGSPLRDKLLNKEHYQSRKNHESSNHSAFSHSKEAEESSDSYDSYKASKKSEGSQNSKNVLPLHSSSGHRDKNYLAEKKLSKKDRHDSLYNSESDLSPQRVKNKNDYGSDRGKKSSSHKEHGRSHHDSSRNNVREESRSHNRKCDRDYEEKYEHDRRRN